jgi:hypothetical protein
VNKSSIRRALLVAALAMGTPVAIAAQQAEALSPVAETELEAWLTEYQEVHTQLEGIQQQALQDPELNSIQEQLGSRIREAMENRDPSIPERITRAQALESELMGAQQAGDVERLQQLMAEAQEIEQYFITVQQAVIEDPSMAPEITAFQTRLEQKMGELDPGATALIARFKELEMKIEAAMRAGA